MFASGVTAINDIVAWNLIDPGDGILLGMPIYGDFHGDLTARAGYTLPCFSLLTESSLLIAVALSFLMYPCKAWTLFLLLRSRSMKPLCRRLYLEASKCALSGFVAPIILSVNLFRLISLACFFDGPAGQCYSSEVLEKYMRFCHKHRIHLISDEVYGLSVFDNGDSTATKFTSVLSFDPAELMDPDFLHACYGMSKV